MKSSIGLVLASRSPRRHAILRFAGIPHRWVWPAGTPEKRKKGESPNRFVRRLAYEKALAVAKQKPDCWVLGADTVVVCRGELMGKPHHPTGAQRMLLKLQGQTHMVWTGVALVCQKEKKAYRHVEGTQVVFGRIPDLELRKYVKTREPYDKAGGYAIQGIAGRWIQGWKGDFFNVMGLPLQWVVRTINRISTLQKGFNP